MDLSMQNENDMTDGLSELSSEFEKLMGAARDLVSSLEKLTSVSSGAAGGADESGALGSLDRLGGQVLDSIHGIGSSLWRGGFDDAGRKFLRNFTGKLGDDVSDAIGDALGGGFLGELFGGLVGELVRGIGGLFGKKKHNLPPAELPDLFNPPAMMSLPVSLLPSSAALGGRAPFANVNVTVNGIVGTPRNVADEVSRIVTRTLSDLNRRGA